MCMRTECMLVIYCMIIRICTFTSRRVDSDDDIISFGTPQLIFVVSSQDACCLVSV